MRIEMELGETPPSSPSVILPSSIEELRLSYQEHFPKTWDNHTLATYQTCPRKFELSILQGLQPKEHARSLAFGLAMHEGLATWYSAVEANTSYILEEFNKLCAFHAIVGTPINGRTLTDFNSLREAYSIAKGITALGDAPSSASADHRTPQLLEAILRGYFKCYRYEPFKVVYVEKNFVFALPNGQLYSGICDLVVEWNEKILPVEHKTTSSLWNFQENFSPNGQVTGYITGLCHLVSNATRQAIVNALLVNKRKDRMVKLEDFQRYPNIERSESQLGEFELNCVHTIDDIRADLQRGFFRMNTSSCHQYGGCPYRPLCRVSPGPERDLVASAFYQQRFWDPLERDHNKSISDATTSE